MDKIVETYNPYNQNVERKSSQLPWYINETFINSVEIRSPFIAGNKWYIGWTLQVWQEWIIIDGNTKTISSSNYIEDVSWWIINWDWDSQFNDVVARWNILWWNISWVDIEWSTIQSSSWDNIVLLNWWEIRQMNTLWSDIYTTILSNWDITFFKQIVWTPWFDVNLDIWQIWDWSKITFWYSWNTKWYIESNVDWIEISSNWRLNLFWELNFNQINSSSHTDSWLYIPIKVNWLDYFIKLYS